MQTCQGHKIRFQLNCTYQPACARHSAEKLQTHDRELLHKVKCYVLIKLIRNTILYRSAGGKS